MKKNKKVNLKKEAKKKIKKIPTNPLGFAKWAMKTTVDDIINLLRPFHKEWNRWCNSTIKNTKFNKEQLVEMVYELIDSKLYSQEEVDELIDKELKEYMEEEMQEEKEIREKIDFNQGTKEFWKKVYVNMARVFHPDKGGNPEDMATLNRVIKPLRI